MMKGKLFTILAGGLLAACSSTSTPEAYTLTASMPEELNGETLFMVNFDTGEKMDSTVITDGTATFTGEAVTTVPVRLVVNGSVMGQLFIDGGEIAYKDKVATGSPLNDAMNAARARMEAIENDYRNAAPDSTGNAAREAAQQEYERLTDSLLMANKDNGIGYTVLIDKAYDADLDGLKALVKEYPVLTGSKRIEKQMTAVGNKAATQPGNPYKDFTVAVNDSLTEKFSDYVGKGKPVLVDFWASWCGPCMRQASVLKEIYAEYQPKGLEVLGVAVWDEPENTEKAIKSHELPWHNIVNAQTIPTDIYGISGIPCIMLIGPDGTILVRDKYGDELKEAVKGYFDGTLTAPATAASAAEKE